MNVLVQVAMKKPKTDKGGIKAKSDYIELTEEQFEKSNKWSDVDWNLVERKVYKLQKRIYKTSKNGDVKKVRQLQKTLMRSWSAKLLAVRRVTQDNKGKKTAGFDGVKNVPPHLRFDMAKNLKLTGKSKPTRRVWIPKPGKDEERPLGIPTMTDRALQALTKIVLEPEWEAKFEPNSYGFRPGRSCHDAIEAIFTAINRKPKFVLDADISKCFDKIDHDKLLQKLNTFPTMRRQVRAWLKAGVFDGNTYENTNFGTPQGGVISPLLANVALHGMENVVKEHARKMKGDKVANQKALSLIRYADDFVILHESLTVIQETKVLIEKWLKDIGLELSLKKTKITHTLNEHEGNLGFDFLGFNVSQYPVGKHHSGKSTNGELLGYKTLIKPSKEKVQLHSDKLNEIIRAHKSKPQIALINALNPVIRGWCNYYSSGVSKDTFSKLKHLTYLKLKRWGERRHPNKNKSWVADQYWHSVITKKKERNWVFSTIKNGQVDTELYNHDDTPVVRHIKVKGEVSPFNGDWVYWAKRMGKSPECTDRVAKLLKEQKGRCPHCNLYFTTEDTLEIDHIIPRCKGGKDEYKNLQLLHRHCHDVKTSNDGSTVKKKDVPTVKGHSGEEPCEVKVSCTVLKTSR